MPWPTEVAPSTCLPIVGIFNYSLSREFCGFLLREQSVVNQSIEESVCVGSEENLAALVHGSEFLRDEFALTIVPSPTTRRPASAPASIARVHSPRSFFSATAA